MTYIRTYIHMYVLHRKGLHYTTWAYVHTYVRVYVWRQLPMKKREGSQPDHFKIIGGGGVREGLEYSLCNLIYWLSKHACM